MTSSGVPVGDTTLLQRLRELAEPEQPSYDRFRRPILREAALSREFPTVLAALPAVVTLIEQAEKVERVIRTCAVEGIEVDADGLGAWAMLLAAALAPFVGEATQ